MSIVHALNLLQLGEKVDFKQGFGLGIRKSRRIRRQLRHCYKESEGAFDVKEKHMENILCTLSLSEDILIETALRDLSSTCFVFFKQLLPSVDRPENNF